jgi:hypothetical protein
MPFIAIQKKEAVLNNYDISLHLYPVLPMLMAVALG